MKTLVTSRGMNEALKYSTQVATVIKAVAVITVAAVVVVMPIIEAGSGIELEFFDVSAQDTYIDYFVEVKDYKEEMDLTVTLHNDFVSRSHRIESGSISQHEEGLEPGMEYKVTVREGSKLVDERTVWTTSAPQASILILGKPIFDRDTSTVTVNFEYNDPTGNTSVVAADVYSVIGTRMASCDPTEGRLVVDVSGITGYDAGMTMYALFKDDTDQKLKTMDVPLYYGDSKIGVTGISMGSDRNVLHLDVDYFDADGLYSDIRANVYVDNVLYGTACEIKDMGTNPYVTLDADRTVKSNSQDIRVTVTYKEHGYSTTSTTDKEVTYSGNLYPNIGFTAGPAFVRSTASVDFTFTYNDPDSETASLNAVIKNVKDVIEYPFATTAGTVSIDVSLIMGYDSTISIYSVDSGSASTLIYEDGIALYVGDSALSLSGIHLENDYRDRVYLDMDYSNADGLYSDIVVDVTVNGTVAATDHVIYDPQSNPFVVLDSGHDINSTSDSVGVTISYNAHTYTDPTYTAQPDITYSGSVPFVKPRATVSDVMRSSHVTLSVALDGSSSAWSDYKVSGYYVEKGSTTHIPFADDVAVADPASVIVDVSSVPEYNVAIYLTMTCTQTIGSAVTTETVFEDVVVPTMMITITNLDLSSNPSYDFLFTVDEVLGFDTSGSPTFDISLLYVNDDNTSQTETYSGTFTITSGEIVLTVGNNSMFSSGQGYLTISCGGLTFMDHAHIEGLHVVQG